MQIEQEYITPCPIYFLTEKIRPCPCPCHAMPLRDILYMYSKIMTVSTCQSS